MGSKTLPDQGRQMSAGPGPEAFFSWIWVWGIVPPPWRLGKSFLNSKRISFSHAYSKNKSLRTAVYLFSSHWMPATVRSLPWTKWFPGFNWNTVSMPLLL